MVGGGEWMLEDSPTWTWVVVLVVIVSICVAVERYLHYLGKYFRNNDKRIQYEVLQKIKDEFMLMGFIGLLLAVFQGAIQKICIPKEFIRHMLPCPKRVTTTTHFASAVPGLQQLLSSGGEASSHCLRKGKVPLLPLQGIHAVHIFIFILAVTHTLLSVLNMFVAGKRIQQWKHWEESIHKNIEGKEICKAREECGKQWIPSWLISFVKQFYGSVTQSDYATMRLGFIIKHFEGDQNYDFFKFLERKVEEDFKKVVGVRLYFWPFVAIFLLLKVNGWHLYSWLSLIPLILQLAFGTKFVHIIRQLTGKLDEGHSVQPSDDHFWFEKPRIVIHLIHFNLFQIALDVAFFFWILTTYGFESCFVGQLCYIVPRLVISVIVQLLCSYSTLPLHAIVSQMGSSYRFDEHVIEELHNWRKRSRPTPDLELGSKLTKLFICGHLSTDSSEKCQPTEVDDIELSNEPIQLKAIVPSN